MVENKTKEHFNRIADSYHEEIPGHIRDELMKRFWKLTSCYFSNNSKVIDIGCGDGSNIAFLRSRGVNAIGVDVSEKLIKRGKERYPQLCDAFFEGDALNLEFQDSSFDIAIMIGLLHHIHSRSEQVMAIEQALRVVKNNGVIIIRECNLVNPLFRVFWNYVFPLTSRIDRFGGENWIPTKYFLELFEERIEAISYFTFIPSFTPQILLPLAYRLEQFLENTPLKEFSAHYVVVLRKY